MSADRTGARSRRRPYAARVPLPERRQQLLDAALRIIVRQGYEHVSIAAIAREADVTRPVVYGAFDGLGDLLGQLLDRQQQRALRQLYAALATPSPDAGPEEFLTAVVRDLVARVTSDPLTWRPILVPPRGTPREVSTRIEADRERLRQRFVELLRGYLTDVPPTSLDPDVLGHALLAIAEHFGRLLLEEPDAIDVDRLVSTIATLVRTTRRGPPTGGPP